MREFAFELRLCAHLEAGAGAPASGAFGGSNRAAAGGVLARQIGASVGRGTNRVVDVLRVEPGPAFRDRTALTPRAIPAAALESDARVGAWRALTDVFEAPPARARRIAERAVEAGFFERTYRDGREVVRRVARYPDWFSRLIGVENKPDLGTPGDLETQLRKDVSLGVLDAVVLATESHVTGAHRNRLPEEVGIWRVDFDRADPIEVVREPRPLPAGEAGVQVRDREPGRTGIRPVTAAEKARKRRRMAERAYGKGWRAPLPACGRAERADAAGATLPRCAHFDRIVDPGAECGPDCPGHVAADPPAVDLDGERDRRTPWVADPDGRAREQAGLDDFA